MSPLNAKSEKRTRKVLSIKEKMELINCHSTQKISAKDLSKKFGIGVQTVYDLLRKKEQILKLWAESDSPHSVKYKHTVKKSKIPIVDKETYKWFRKEKVKGTPISGDMIIEKAKNLHSELKISSECNYSSDWLEEFIKRHGISQLKSTEEKENLREDIESDVHPAPFEVLAEETHDNEFASSSKESVEDNKKTRTLSLAIEGSNALLKFIENYNCLGISKSDVLLIHRIQRRLLKDQSEAQNGNQTTLTDFFKC